MPIPDSILEKYTSAKSLSNDYLKSGDKGTAGPASDNALNALANAKFDLASSSDPMAVILIAEINETENLVQNKIDKDKAYNPKPQSPEAILEKNIMPKNQSNVLNSILSGAPESGALVGPGNNQSTSRLFGSNASKDMVGTAPPAKSPSIRYALGSEKSSNVTPVEEDWRIRISVGQKSSLFYLSNDPGIMKPLVETAGVIFPYTPSITVSYSAGYSSQKNTHSNYPAYSYDSSEVQAIQISGDFTVQNQSDGEYLLAAIYFFRSASKMFYGASNHAGSPPPILFLNGYGENYFPNVPCVLTSFSQTMPSDMDYMSIDTNGSNTRLPTSSQIVINLQPVYSRASIAKFDLENFAKGNLLKAGGFI